jgi:hypothetical protein
MFWRKRTKSDFNAEVSAHLELEIERLRDEGLSQAEAEAEAHRQFGSMTRAQERFHESSRWMLLEHLRVTFRMLSVFSFATLDSLWLPSSLSRWV